MTTHNDMRGALLPLAVILLMIAAGGSSAMWKAISPDAPGTSGTITGPEALSDQAVRLVPVPRPTIAPETLVPAVLLPPAPPRVFAVPTDEYFESLSRPFNPPTFEQFNRDIEHKTKDPDIATALWQIPAVREAYNIYAYVHYMLGFVQGYYEREVMRASYNLPSVSLATDIGDVGLYLLANAADRDAMRAAFHAFEAGVAVAAHSRDLQAAYDAGSFRAVRDQLENQIRSIPRGVQSLQVLRDSTE